MPMEFYRWVEVMVQQYVDELYHKKNSTYLRGLAIACREETEWSQEALEETFEVFVLDAIECAWFNYHQRPDGHPGTTRYLDPKNVLEIAKMNKFKYGLLLSKIYQFCLAETTEEKLADGRRREQN